MPAEKITFEEFFESVDDQNRSFVQNFHKYMMENGCKVAFELKKNGYLASYKYGKPIRTVMNFVFRKEGMLARIYGEHISKYPAFLESLPQQMLQHLSSAGDCKRLTSNTCSPKCIGYDFKIFNQHYQKCRYNCFEFLMTNESRPSIQQFVEHELDARMAGL
ncbi:MAG: hypothetical protein FWC78_03510 [Defluviitaleaceae bacterium]|nr:hypothetical protein [Defluviitaleaceae bacterium]